MTNTAMSIPARKIDIVQDIQGRVLSGEWAQGSQLPSERELAIEYGVSRPVIREALAGLVELGFIEIHPGRGSFVRGVKIDDLSGSLTRAATLAGITARDLVVARLGLECSAAELAAQQSPRPVERLRATLHEHSVASSLQALADTDLAFHETVVAASGNPLLVLMFGAIRTQVHALMLRSHSDPNVQREGEPYHERIVQAIEDGRPTAARDLMREHLELALTLYGSDLDRPISEVVESRGLRFASVLTRPETTSPE
jgi:GntR family transcriptional regulator, transcriptional repressor for pyruvate dehydrogenase complex